MAMFLVAGNSDCVSDSSFSFTICASIKYKEEGKVKTGLSQRSYSGTVCLGKLSESGKAPLNVVVKVRQVQGDQMICSLL